MMMHTAKVDHVEQVGVEPVRADATREYIVRVDTQTIVNMNSLRPKKKNAILNG